jgi:predicted phage terminase large subunit-like protein
MCESGNVILLRSCPHLSDLLSEAEAFPNGSHDDTLDPLMDAIEEICGVKKSSRGTVW